MNRFSHILNSTHNPDQTDFSHLLKTFGKVEQLIGESIKKDTGGLKLGTPDPKVDQWFKDMEKKINYVINNLPDSNKLSDMAEKFIKSLKSMKLFIFDFNMWQKTQSQLTSTLVSAVSTQNQTISEINQKLG